jgi:hypothetical protein
MFSVDNSLEELLECKLPEGYLTKISESEKELFARNLHYFNHGIFSIESLKDGFDRFVRIYGEDFLKANVKDYEAAKKLVYPNIQLNFLNEIRSNQL